MVGQEGLSGFTAEVLPRSSDPICIFAANVSNVLLVGASAGRESGRTLQTP
jgi:hypothetical protein